MQGQPPVIIDRSEGWHVHDRWGNMWLDWSSGVLISNIGNSNPAIVAAIQEMLARPLLSTYVFSHEKRGELAELLVGLAPSADYKAFLLTTGSEATENCIKLAKSWGQARRGPRCRVLVSFENAFHGRTMGAQLPGEAPGKRRGSGPSMKASSRFLFPTGTRTPTRDSGSSWRRCRRRASRRRTSAASWRKASRASGPTSFPCLTQRASRHGVEKTTFFSSWTRCRRASVGQGRGSPTRTTASPRPDRLRQGHLQLAAALRGDRSRRYHGALSPRFDDLHPFRLPAPGRRGRCEYQGAATGRLQGKCDCPRSPAPRGAAGHPEAPPAAPPAACRAGASLPASRW